MTLSSSTLLLLSLLSSILVPFRADCIEVGVIIPFYNEEGNVATVLDEVKAAFKSSPISAIIVAVDDGSNDATLERLRYWSQQNQDQRISVVTQENSGQSAAILHGYALMPVAIEYIATLDGDGQIDPMYFNDMLATLENNPETDAVIGARQNRPKRGLVHRTLSYAANLARVLITQRFSCFDNGCSLKLLRAQVFAELPQIPRFHRWITALLEIQEKRIAVIPINERVRYSGTSHYTGSLNKTVKRVLQTVADLCNLTLLKLKFGRNIQSEHTTVHQLE